MGRVSSAAGNAAMDPFWALLQKNAPHTRTWTSRAPLHKEIVHWIENTSTTADGNDAWAHPLQSSFR